MSSDKECISRPVAVEIDRTARCAAEAVSVAVVQPHPPQFLPTTTLTFAVLVPRDCGAAGNCRPSSSSPPHSLTTRETATSSESSVVTACSVTPSDDERGGKHETDLSSVDFFPFLFITRGINQTTNLLMLSLQSEKTLMT